MKEIESRLNDAAWDMEIARKVLSRRRSHDRILFGSAGAFLSAVLITTGLFLAFPISEEDPINQQVSGVYKTQYSESSLLTGEDTDTLLIEILAMR